MKALQIVGASLVLAVISSPWAGATPPLPSYTPLKLHELMGLADVMITASIVEVREETVVVELTRVGFGEPTSPLVVRRFKDWTCASRWAPYEVGQHCVYFLAAPREGPAPYSILGAGCEGERPVGADADHVDLPGKYSGSIDALMSEARAYRAHFRFVRWPENYVIERECEEKELAAYGASGLARTLVEETLRGKFRDPDALSPAPRGATVRWDLGMGLLPSAVVALPDLDADGLEDLACAQETLWILHPSRSGGSPRRERFAGDDRFSSGCTSLALIGERDPDGSFDLAAGDPRASEGGACRGAVWIFSVLNDGALARSTKITLDNPVFGGAQVAFAGFGKTLAGVGDLDGDGRGELAVSESSNNWGPGQIWILFLDAKGAPRRAVHLMEEAEVPGGDLNLAAVGDVNRDGVSDLAMGAPSDGSVWLFLLRADGACERAVTIARHERGLGVAVAGLGDRDGDGTVDVAVSSGENIRILSLTSAGLLASQRELVTANHFSDPLPDRSRFGGVIATWLSSGSRSLIVSGFSWIDRKSVHESRRYPSLWSIDLDGPTPTPR